MVGNIDFRILDSDRLYLFLGHLEYGIYTIKPTSSAKPFQVLCDMQTQGGGWTQIQKRVDGRTNFYRGWTDYKFGFGYLDEGHEFWLGNEKIHQLTGNVQ